MPVDVDWSVYFRDLSGSAAAMASQVGGVPVTAEDVAAGAAGLVEEAAKEIMITRLQDAISQVSEYQLPQYAEALIETFSMSQMIVFTTEGVIINAYEIAGDWADLLDGVEAARAELGVGNHLSKASALAYWMERIYIPARTGGQPALYKKQKKDYDYIEYGRIKYEETIGARRRNWQNMAPFWLWLEFGNPGGGPENAPTHFAAIAEAEINMLYRDALQVTTEQIMEGLQFDVDAWINNMPEMPPANREAQIIESFQPWKELIVNGQQVGAMNLSQAGMAAIGLAFGE